MDAIKAGADAYEVYKNANNGKKIHPEEYENPYDPDCVDYELFHDGWTEAEAKRSN